LNILYGRDESPIPLIDGGDAFGALPPKFDIFLKTPEMCMFDENVKHPAYCSILKVCI
jgi:hypothetical protein